jgi:hypothetical protein
VGKIWWILAHVAVGFRGTDKAFPGKNNSGRNSISTSAPLQLTKRHWIKKYFNRAIKKQGTGGFERITRNADAYKALHSL